MVTIKDVAERAGVSIATVSYIVNNSRGVSAHSRDVVETAIRELGYQRNEAARALVSRKSRTIALVFPALIETFNGIHARFFAGAASEAAERGYQVMLSPIGDSASDMTKLVGSGVADGVILMQVRLDDPRVETLQKLQSPFILIGRTRHPEALPYADIDFARSVDDAVEHLADLGHRHIVLVTRTPHPGSPSAQGAVARITAAFDAAADRRAFTPTIIECDETAIAGQQTAGVVIAEHPSATATVIINIGAVAGYMNGLSTGGVDVPTDHSVILFGGTAEIAQSLIPNLTVTVSPGAELGALAARGLIAMLEDDVPSPPQTLLPNVFHDGASTGPPPTR